MWKNILETIKEKKYIEIYLVQERLGKKMCRDYCKQTLREALFFLVGYPVAKTPKSTGNSATHDSSVHEEHVSRLSSITAMNGCWVCEVFLQFLDFSTFKNNKWLKKWTYLKVRINLSAKLLILIVNNNVFMHQSMETTAPRPPGHSGGCNIPTVLHLDFYPSPRGNLDCYYPRP